jgi:hypothetical protein
MRIATVTVLGFAALLLVALFLMSNGIAFPQG